MDNSHTLTSPLQFTLLLDHSRPTHWLSSSRHKAAFMSIISFHLNWMHCHWSQPRRTGSCAVKRLSFPWLQPVTARSVQLK